MAVGARELVRMESPRPGVFNGEDFQKIDKAEIVHEITEVVEIAFVDDAVVLAWLFPQRRPRSGGRTLSATGGVACRGAPVWASDAAASRQQLRMRNTFLCEAPPGTQRRSSSVGDQPNSSVGSLRHREDEPGLCTICPMHHRHLLGAGSPPCRHGHRCVLGCNFSHRDDVGADHVRWLTSRIQRNAC